MTMKESFGDYSLIRLENHKGMTVTITDLGATVQSIFVPDRDGNVADVILGYDTPEEYLENDGYFGACIGRYANRIKGARFSLNGVEYKITANEGKNTLHGGTGYQVRRFNIDSMGEDYVLFSLTDPDGTDGFPAKLEVKVKYELTDGNELKISYEAVSDGDTVVNLTNHCYFNLAGQGNILSHELMINADSYLEVDSELIPTKACFVEGTEFDFRKPREVEKPYYDHCYVLMGELCAEVYERQSGRKMKVITDMPGVQFYAGGTTSDRRGKNGARYGKNSALCLETQFFPDAPNRPDFPSTVLKAGEVFKSTTSYIFSAE